MELLGPQRLMPLKVCIKSGDIVAGYRSNFVNILKQAFQDWADASNGLVNPIYVDSESNAAIVCTWTNNPKDMMSSAEGGHAMVIPNDEGITKGKIILLTVSPSGGVVTDNNARRLDLHEIGHALGIMGHSKNSSDIMFSSLPPVE